MEALQEKKQFSISTTLLQSYKGMWYLTRARGDKANCHRWNKASKKYVEGFPGEITLNIHQKALLVLKLTML